MKKYEYKIIAIKYTILFSNDKELNKLGEEGWEAVGMAGENKRVYVLLKREI